MSPSVLTVMCVCPECGYREDVFTERSTCLYVRCPRCDVWMRSRASGAAFSGKR